MRLPILASVLATLALVPRVAAADTDAAPADEPVYRCNAKQGDVLVTFKPEMEVRELVTWAVGFTCKKFIYDGRIVAAGKKVTVIAPQRLSRDDAYQVFEAALATANLAVVPRGAALAIVDAPAAKKESLPIYKKAVPAGDEIVRYIVHPTHVQPETLKTAFGALKSDSGDLVTINSILLVTDYASHVRDMVSLLPLVDVPGGTDGIYTIPVLHSDATKLAATLDKLLGGSAKDAAPGTPKILVDERTNTLLVSASESGYRRAKAIVDRVDIALAMEDGAALHVYPLGSAIADELAQTLEKAISNQKSAATSPDKKAPATGATTGSPLDALPVLQGTVHVVSDKPSNSLLVTASSHDYLALKDIIRQLDLPRRQVFIDAMILRVNITDDTAFGASSHVGKSTSSGSLLVGAVQTGGTNTLDLGTTAGAASLSNTQGLLAGIVGSSTSLLGVSIPSYAVLFNALATQGNTEILSEPSIIAVDNEQATYKIGTSIPYQKGLAASTATGSTVPITNIEHEPLVLELDIKPHISTGDTVLLEVKHHAEEIAATDPVLGPSWLTRDLDTRVLVGDQHTVVIGGLMETKNITNVTKVPLLGDIPLLGYLFKYKTTTKTKSDLLIMLTPYIIRDQADLERIRARKAMQYDEFTRSFEGLAHADYVRDIDYGKKRGLVEEINRDLEEVEREAAAREALNVPPGVVPGLVEPVAPLPPAP